MTFFDTDTDSFNLIQLIEHAKLRFIRHYNCEPTLVAYSPGRINLIGEHTDYNEGFVMPMVFFKHLFNFKMK